MPVDVKEKGNYELFETTHKHRILVLDGKKWYAWVEGQQGEILVLSDSDHKKARTIQKGKFFIVEFKEDPKFKDMPHLFLEKGNSYQEMMLPNGLPVENDHQKKIVTTDETLGIDELEDYLKNPAPAGPGEERMDRPGGGSVANVAHHLKGIDLPASREEVVRYARSNDAPEEVIEALKGMKKGSFETMADVMKALGEGKSHQGQQKGGQQQNGNLPIDNYDELTVDEVTEQLESLNKNELKALKKYEQRHKDRKAVLEAIDRKLD